MTGLQFFNYDRLGYIPHDCWEECELEPKGKESPSAKDRKRTKRTPSGYLQERRSPTPEEELILREETENDTDAVELGEKITFVEFEDEIIRPLKSRLNFSLAAAAKLARLLSYQKDEIDNEAAQVLGFYLAEDGGGDIAGMDGVIGFFLSNPDSIDIADSVATFAQRMKPHCPEISENSRLALIEEAKRNHMAFSIGAILFGAMTFKHWVS